MIRQRIHGYILVVILIIAGNANAQPVASFEVQEGQDSVCVNDNIHFTNTSDVSGCSNPNDVDYEWDFGDGSTSFLENPVYNYNESGLFTVTLSVTCDGSSVQETMDIYVLPTPIAGFEPVSYMGCIPYEHSFENTTTQEGGGSVDNYVWTFGDGTSSTEENPVHEYNQTGTFNIMLEAINENGCSSHYSQENAIMLSDTPVVSISADPQSWCYSPIDINFNSNIVVSNGLGYNIEWDFGDGTSGQEETEENPTHTYTSDGNYDVSVTVEDDYGCISVVDSINYVHIQPVLPAFTLYNSSYEEITEGVICIGEQTYFFCDNEGYGASWNFDGGNPTTSNQVSAEVVFNTAGTHNITLTVDPGGECETDTSFNVVVEDPQPAFTIDEDFSCNAPLSVHFSASCNVDVDEYHWIFGDGDDGYGEETDHTYDDEGNFYPSLEVTSTHGCTGSYSGPQVSINSPSAAFSVDSTGGCSPLNVTATYDSVTNPDDIITFNWDFYSNIADPNSYDDPFNGTTIENHEYTDTGIYFLELTVTDINGCVDSFEVEVSVGEHQTPIFDYSSYPAEVCPWDSLSFSSLSEDPDHIDAYEWLFGDTADWQWGTSNEQHPADFTFHQDTGWVQVVHVVENNGCRDSLFIDSLFYVNGPIIYDISYIHECNVGNEYLFEVDLVEADTWDWIIQDDGLNTINQHLNTTDSTIIYEFPGTGEHWVIVNAQNSSTGCEFRDSIQLNVIQPVASFTLNPDNICSNEEFLFEESGSQNAEEYYWDFGDGQNSGWMPDDEITHIYHTHGDVSVCLHVRDEDGCEDSVCHDLYIAGPDINITSSYPVDGCTPYELTIEGIVEADDDIAQITVDIQNSGGFSDSDSPAVNGTNSVPFTSVFTLSQPGTYDVVITAWSGSCQDSLVIPAYIELVSLDANFIAESVDDQDRQVCVGDSLEFIPNLQDDVTYTYEWDFGDGSPVSNEMLPVYSYTDPGIYDVTLTISGAGCLEIMEKTAYIEVQEANAGFTVSNTEVACPPLTLNIGDITHDAPEYPSANYLWYSGYLNEQGNGYNAYEFSYSEAGEYYLKFEVTTSFGCHDVQQELLTIGGPSGDMFVNGEHLENGSTVNACLHDTLDFSIENGEGIDYVEWTFGEGGSAQGDSTSYVYHYMPSSGNPYRVDVTLSGSGCENMPPMTVFVDIYNVQASFSLINPESGMLADTFQCSPFTLNLTDISTGDDLLYNWHVEGLGTYTEPNWDSVLFVNNTQMDSVVDITLEVENTEVGCWDDTVRQVVIGYVPDPNATTDTIICENDGFYLHAENGEQYVWYPGLYLSETDVSDPYAAPEEDMTYYLTVTSASECVNKDTVEVTIQYPVASSIGSSQDTIIIGESVSNYIETDQPAVDIQWLPDINISCTGCENPTFYPRETQSYVVSITDSLGCFTEELSYDVFVDIRYTLDVPKAFTPEGNQVNRIVYVKGVGIKDLKEFSIYNRWGEKLFQTDDIDEGWDGYYKGKLQSVDTYVFYVEAEMWDGNIKTQKGTIMLMQ